MSRAVDGGARVKGRWLSHAEDGAAVAIAGGPDRCLPSLLARQLIAIVAIVLVIEAVSAGMRTPVARSFPGRRSRLAVGSESPWPRSLGLSWSPSSSRLLFSSTGSWWTSASRSHPLLSGGNLRGTRCISLAMRPWWRVSLRYRWRPSRLARLFERATYVGFAVPGIVIGLALVFLGTRAVPTRDLAVGVCLRRSIPSASR